MIYFNQRKPLNSGRILVNGSSFYCGNSTSNLCQLALKSDIPTQYVHPAEKQCSYSYTHPSSQQCSNVNATTLDGHPASYFATAASNLQMGYVEYTGMASGTEDLGQTISVASNAKLIITSVHISENCVSSSNGIRPHYAILSPSCREFRSDWYGSIVWSGSSVTVVCSYRYGTFYGFNVPNYKYIVIYFY